MMMLGCCRDRKGYSSTSGSYTGDFSVADREQDRVVFEAG
jgi:hypothetical protein